MTKTRVPHANCSAPSNPAAPSTPEDGAAPGGRDANGRFAKNNPGGPGNPFARKVAAFRTKFLAAVTDDDLETIARSLLDEARQGDVPAARLVLSYVLGKPAPQVDPDRLDEMEWQQWKREYVDGQDLSIVSQGISASLACPLASAMVAGNQSELKDYIVDRMSAAGERDKQVNEPPQQQAERAEEQPAECESELTPSQQPVAAPSAAPRQAAPRRSTSIDIPAPLVVSQSDAERLPVSSALDDGHPNEVLPLPGATVTKRGQTVHRAANNFVD